MNEELAKLARRAERFQIAEPSLSKCVQLDVPLSVLIKKARTTEENEEEPWYRKTFSPPQHHYSKLTVERRIDTALIATRTTEDRMTSTRCEMEKEQEEVVDRQVHYKRPMRFPPAHYYVNHTIEQRVDSALTVDREGGEKIKPRFRNQTWTMPPPQRFPNLKWKD